MKSSFIFAAMVVCTISRKFYRKENTMIKEKVRASELNSFASIRACRPWRVISAQTWLATILILSEI
jgi:hypothetical protein